jgi:hypothetical protein
MLAMPWFKRSVTSRTTGPASSPRPLVRNLWRRRCRWNRVFFVNDFCVPLYQTLRRHREAVKLARLLYKSFGRRLYTLFGNKNRYQSQLLHREAVTLGLSTKHYGGIREQWILRDFFISRSAAKADTNQHGVNKH